MEGLVVPTIRSEMSRATAVYSVMKHVRVVSIIDPSILGPQWLVER